LDGDDVHLRPKDRRRGPVARPPGRRRNTSQGVSRALRRLCAWSG
jgi:hypothetical protein